MDYTFRIIAGATTTDMTGSWCQTFRHEPLIYNKTIINACTIHDCFYLSKKKNVSAWSKAIATVLILHRLKRWMVYIHLRGASTHKPFNITLTLKCFRIFSVPTCPKSRTSSARHHRICSIPHLPH